MTCDWNLRNPNANREGIHTSCYQWTQVWVPCVYVTSQFLSNKYLEFASHKCQAMCCSSPWVIIKQPKLDFLVEKVEPCTWVIKGLGGNTNAKFKTLQYRWRLWKMKIQYDVYATCKCHILIFKFNFRKREKLRQLNSSMLHISKFLNSNCRFPIVINISISIVVFPLMFPILQESLGNA